MIVVYTVITGNYDNLRPPADPSGARWVCFTDRPRVCAPWEIQPFPACGLSPRRASRIPKMLPHLLLPRDTTFSIYHDGAFRALRQAGSIMSECCAGTDLGLWKHPTNTSIYDECNFYARHHGAVPQEIESEVERYKDLPADGQFWCGGLVIRRHSPAVERFNELWFRDYLDGSNNDQFPLWASVKRTGVSVTTNRNDILADPRIGYHLHADTGCNDNPGYGAENAAWNERMGRIERLVLK